LKIDIFLAEKLKTCVANELIVITLTPLLVVVVSSKTTDLITLEKCNIKIALTIGTNNLFAAADKPDPSSYITNSLI